MADKDRTPEDLLGSLLSGKKPVSQDTGIPVSQQAVIPASQQASKPVRKKAVTKPAQAPAKKEDQAPGEKVKATFYISSDIVEDLEAGWLQLRRLVSKDKRSQVSKSLIVEVALQLALQELKSKKDKSQLAKKAGIP